MKRTTIYAGLVILVVISCIAVVLKINHPVGPSGQQGAADLQSATYWIDGRTVTLSGETRYFGNELRIDLDSDGREDSVFFITHQSGGSGTFYYVVAALQTVNGYVGTPAIFVGDRIAPQTIDLGIHADPASADAANSIIAVNYADRAPGESFSVRPSVGKTLWLRFDLASMKLVDAKEYVSRSGAAALIAKKWAWVSTTYSDSTKFTPKKAADFVITFDKDSTFSVKGDCNSLGGKYKATEHLITFTDTISTLMFCENSREGDFQKTLDRAASYFFLPTGELVIDLKYDSGSAIFRPIITLSLPSRKVLGNSYHVFQTFNNCGPAALSMVLSYFGIRKDQAELAQEIRPYNNKSGLNDNKSTPPPLLAAKAEEYGLRTYYRANGSIQRLQALVAEGIPVLVRTHLHRDDTIAHYRIVKGYDTEAGYLVQDDSYQGKDLKYSYADFHELWEPFNRAYLVIVPEAKREIVEQILAAELDEGTAWRGASDTARQKLAASPDDVTARFNLSTASFYLGDYAGSVKAFEMVQSRLPTQMLWYQVEPVEAYFRLGNYPRVFELSEKIINSGNLAFAELYALRGKSFQALGDEVSAQAEFAKAAKYSTSPAGNGGII